MYKKKPNLESIKVFGCSAFVHVEKIFRGKIDRTSQKEIFLGSSDHRKTYLVGIPNDKGVFKVRKSRNVTFNENEMFIEVKEKKEEIVNKHHSDGDRNLNPVAFLGEIVNNELLPKSIDEAIRDKNWYEAMKLEYNSSVENKVWELVENKGNKPIGSRWHFALKFSPSGEITRYKARLVAKGFSQVPGRDYNETHSPTTRLSTIRVLISYAVYKNTKLKQMDIKTAYLNADIEDEIFMQQPEGFEKFDKQGNPLICKLRKSLYGLKQSGRNWYLTIKTFLNQLGFTPAIQNECLFIKKGENGIEGLVCLWVDDMVILGLQEDFCENFKNKVSDQFQISSYGDLSWFLNIKIERTQNEIMLSQEAYVEKLLEKFNMSESKTLETPLDVSLKLSKLDSPEIGSNEHREMQSCDYRRIVGCLNYLSLTSRPDIAHAANLLSSFVENPGRRHWNAAKGCLRYLKGTKSEKMLFRKNEKLELTGFSDSDWAGNTDIRKSTSGFCFKLNNSSGAISWASKLQKCVSTSTAEDELNAVVEANEEAVHLVNLLRELDVEIQQPVNVFVDNQACIALSKNSMNLGKTKHFSLKVHFVRNLVHSRLLELNYLPTDRMPADTLTKALGRTKVSLFCDVLLGTNT